MGTELDDSFRSGRKTTDMFVFNVHIDVKSEKVKQHITDKISIENFAKMSNDNAPMQSFKFTISCDDYDNIMKPEFWPKGVRCRRFIYKRRIPNPNGLNRDSSGNPS